MNLGQFIDNLSCFPKSLLVVFITKTNKRYYPKIIEYHSEENNPKIFHSYRGYYCDIAISIGEKETNYTVASLLTEAFSSINFQFEGYKGGYYTMNENSDLWVSRWGKANNFKCIKMTSDNSYVYIDISKIN